MKNRTFKTIRILIIVAIIVVVGVLGINYALKLLKQKQHDDCITDLLVVQAKIKIIKGKADVSSDKSIFVGTKISDYWDNDTKNFLKHLQINDSEFDKFYILSIDDLKKLGIFDELKHKENNNYIVNYETSEVIYKDGIIENEQVKYKISDIVKKENPKYWILHNRGNLK